MVTEESRHTTALLEAFLEAGQLLGYKVLDDLVKGVFIKLYSVFLE